jgi:4-amino-4-deoxy-L-arabinose transferase-like glycosyltransferase
MEKSRIILLAIVALFIFSAMPFAVYHSLFWDEAVYIGLGKSIWSFGNVGIWEPIRPLGLPLIIGLFWSIGLPVIVSSQGLAMFFSAAAIILAYFVGRQLFNNFVAVISAVILSVTPVFLTNSPDVMTEIPSAAIAMAAVLFFIRKKYILAGLFSGLVFLFKFPLALVAIALLISLAVEQAATRKWQIREFLELVIPFFAIIAPYFILNRVLYHSAFSPLVSASAHQYNPVHAVNGLANIFYYLAYFLLQNPLLAFSLAGLFFVFRKGINKAIVIVPALLFCYFTWMPNKQPRFGLTFLPFIAILAAYGISCLISKRKSLAISAGVLLIVAFAASISAVVVMKTTFASQFPQKNAEMQDFNSFFAGRQESQILTTTPLPAAFSDNKFIAMYDNPAEALRVYGNYSSSASAAIFTSDFFPCEHYGEQCEKDKAQLFSGLSAHKILKNISNDYFIFSLS